MTESENITRKVLIERYVNALISRLEQTDDLLLAAVLTSRIEHYLGEPVGVKLEVSRRTRNGHGDATPVIMRERAESGRAEPEHAPSGDRQPAKQQRQRSPTQTPVLAWLQQAVARNDGLSARQLAEQAISEQLWDPEPDINTATNRIYVTLNHHKVGFEKVPSAGRAVVWKLRRQKQTA